MQLQLDSIGHGTLDAAAFVTHLRAAGIANAIDIRRFPGSRLHPQFNSDALATTLRSADITYRSLTELGGRRLARPESPNIALRNAAFRGYADYMQTAEFTTALLELLMLAADRPTVMLCSETLWWRCHRRLVADAVVLLHRGVVRHIVGAMSSVHVPTPGVRREDAMLVYDGRVQSLL